MKILQSLPDPLIYSLVAVLASGALYSTIHHAKTWRLRKARRVKLKGADGKKIEDSLTSWSLGTLAGSVNYNVAFAAKKILVERALRESCLWTLLARLDSPQANIRMESLVTLRYLFEFTHKTRNFQDHNRAWLLVLRFALGHFHPLLMCLQHSIDDPAATRLALQNITFLMRTHKQCRIHYARSSTFKEWRQNPRNPLYSLETVEGLLIVSSDDPTGDVFLPEVRRFIYYIGEQYWPLPEENYPPRIVGRFHRIWEQKGPDRPPMPQFHDPGEIWFSDRESEHSEEEEGYDYEGYDDVLNTNEEDRVGFEDRSDLDLLDDEPDVVTPENIMVYLNAAEEAGLRSQDRRRNARRELAADREVGMDPNQI